MASTGWRFSRPRSASRRRWRIALFVQQPSARCLEGARRLVCADHYLLSLDASAASEQEGTCTDENYAGQERKWSEAGQRHEGFFTWSAAQKPRPSWLLLRPSRDTIGLKRIGSSESESDDVSLGEARAAPLGSAGRSNFSPDWDRLSDHPRSFACTLRFGPRDKLGHWRLCSFVEVCSMDEERQPKIEQRDGKISQGGKARLHAA